MSRKSWTWYPEAKSEFRDFQQSDTFLLPELAARLEGATAITGRRPGQAGVGRVRRLAIVTSTTYWVLFVERQDGRGLGGLLLHRCDGTECDPPSGAYDVAAYRLSNMSAW